MASAAWQRRIGRLWPAFVLGAGVALAGAVVVRPGPFPGETAAVRLVQRVGEPVPTVAESVWFLTGTEPTLLLVAVAAPVVLWRWRRRGAVGLAVVAVTLVGVVPLTKALVDRPRPSAELVDVRVDHDSSSFPSGHVASTTTVWGAAVAVSSRAGRRAIAAAAALPIAATLGASAVTGAHWPTDAAGGALLGATAAWSVVGVLGDAVRPDRRVPGATRSRP